MRAEDQLELGNWSANEVAPADRARAKLVPRKVRQQVRKAHNGLGHPSKPVQLRMFRLGGVSQDAMDYLKLWNCPVCIFCSSTSSAGSIQ